jgi:hypothetical protein
VRSFLRHGGAPVSLIRWQLEGQDDTIAVPVGAFAELRFPAPTVSVYERRKHFWVCVPIDVEHLA